jgi:hypothetical protein
MPKREPVSMSEGATGVLVDGVEVELPPGARVVEGTVVL